MRILRPFTVLASATLVLGLFTEASAAQTVQSAGGPLAGPEGQAVTNVAKTFRIAGTAVDADGKPVAGAVVEYYYSRGYGDMEAKQGMTTATNGGFEFQASPGLTIFLARKPGLAPAWARYDDVTEDLTSERLVLTPPSTLAGVVVDESGKPVADAEVWVSSAYGERPGQEGGVSNERVSGKPVRDCFSTRTATDGKFVIQGFPTNAAADLGVSKPGKVLRELGRRSMDPETMRCWPGQRDIRLVVEAACSIEGKVVAQDTEQPLAGMRLRLRANEPQYFSDEWREPAESGVDGKFRLADVASGDYQIRATFGTNPVPEWVAETVSVTVETGQTRRDVKVSASRGGFLEVAVLGTDDRRPVTDAGVAASQAAYYADARSGTNGVALLRLPPGEYEVSAYKDDSRFKGTSATVETGRTNRIEIKLRLRAPAKIIGVVHDPSGAPAPGVALSICPRWNTRVGEVKTDAKGRYEIPWDPQVFREEQETPCLGARDVGRNLATAQDIEEGATTLDLRLEPGLAVAGRVEDVNGKPLSNAIVRVSLRSGNSGSRFDDKPIRTDAQGCFQITALPPGRKYHLWADAKGYGSADQNIEENPETNRVELPPFVLKVADRKLAGVVVDADEKPLARAYVFMFRSKGQPYGSARTDDNGRFKFDAVCEGRVELSACSASSQGGQGDTQTEAGETNVVIRLSGSRGSSGGEAPGRPLLKGKPLPDLTVVALSGDAVPAGKPVLLCLFDLEQRPSRQLVRQLVQQHEAFRQNGLVVLGVQAAITTAEAFKAWKEANPLPFPVGRVVEKADKTKWASEVGSLPWLILTDKAHCVTAEGFPLEELEAKLKAQSN